MQHSRSCRARFEAARIGAFSRLIAHTEEFWLNSEYDKLHDPRIGRPNPSMPYAMDGLDGSFDKNPFSKTSSMHLQEYTSNPSTQSSSDSRRSLSPTQQRCGFTVPVSENASFVPIVPKVRQDRAAQIAA